MKKIAFIVTLLAMALTGAAQERVFAPSGTFKFADRDTCSLYLDIYRPAEGSRTSIDGREKPTVLFIFGGGFVEGERNNAHERQWYKRLTDEGYPVVAIDYRLGLKGYNSGFGMAFIHAVQHAIDISVDDLFSATLWLLEHGREYGVDAANMVVRGSSAGAITALQAEYEIANRSERAASIPEGFNYAGVMAFSGALYSYQGGPWYKNQPCPTLLFHGTDDKIVPYKKMKLGRLFFGGLDPLAKMYKKKGYNYQAIRFDGHGHEIASCMMHLIHEELRFMETNVMRNAKYVIDHTVDDPTIPIPDWAKMDYKAIYE